MHDFCIVGGGIVGLATALAILERQPGAGILVLEKEQNLGQHQTGHNSGVIHAGVYYAPGSLKARLCRAGEQATKEFCDQHAIPYETPGKLIVATTAPELVRMEALETNAKANGITTRRIGAEELRGLESEVIGLGALLVETTGIVDYGAVAREMGRIIVRSGGEIVYGVNVDRFEEQPDFVRIVAGEQQWQCRKAIACAGLQADRLAEQSGMKVDFRIVPFRGEYFAIRPERRNIVTRMIYPVPDPGLPFLGIHLTPMIDGNLTVGPNAVLGFSREGYEKLDFDVTDMAVTFAFPVSGRRSPET